MHLSLQQKEQFFHELHESIRSGTSLPQAIERRAKGRGGKVKEVAAAMLARADEQTPRAYFGALPEVFSVLDREIIEGGESSGRLDAAMAYLRDYYDALARSWRRTLARLAYPLVLLHLAAVLLAIPAAVQGGFGAFAWQAIGMLMGFYLLLFLIWLVATTAAKAAGTNAGADRLLQSLPGVGGARVALVSSRFCKLMGLLVKAGSGILTSMDRSASASGSALFRLGAARAGDLVRNGDGLGQAVISTGAFPESIDRAFQVGEESGRLDEEMERQAGRYTEMWFARLEGISFWLSSLIYLMIAGTIAWKIISFYIGYFGQINSLLN